MYAKILQVRGPDLQQLFLVGKGPEPYYHGKGYPRVLSKSQLRSLRVFNKRLWGVRASEDDYGIGESPKPSLKVHKIENFFDSDFGICFISLLVMSKY